MNFIGQAKPLDEIDIAQEAQRLGCDTPAIWAVCDIESAASGFLPDKRPKILFEAHYFHTLTRGIYDRAYPNVSSPNWDRSLYGASGSHQYDRLDVAMGLDPTFALESASWGRFQIMGANFKSCGYKDVVSFVQAVCDDEANHLTAFGNFCNSSAITHFLIAHDWEHFALRYNGPGQVSDYAGKLAAAYARRLSSGGSAAPHGVPKRLRLGDTGIAVTSLQTALLKLGYANVIADGTFGPLTDTAVKDFQHRHGLLVDGVVGPVTLGQINQAAAAI